MAPKPPVPDEVAVRRGERVEASAPGVALTDRALYVGGERVPRDQVTGVEFDRGRAKGAMVFLGREGELGRAECAGMDRVALEDVERRLAPPPGKRHIAVTLDRPFYAPGDTVRGHVTVEWPRACPVRGVRVGLCGTEETRVTVTRGYGRNRRRVTYREIEPVIDDGVVLWGRRPVSWWRAAGEAMSRLVGRLDYADLPAGRHRYAFEFAIPRDAPPSYAGAHAAVAYRLFAHVDVPLAFDLAYEAPLRIVGPRPRHVAAHAAERTERASGLLKPFQASLDMQIEVDRADLASGHLRGRLRLTNHSEKRLRAVNLALVAYEWAIAGGHVEESERELATGRLRIPDPEADQQVATWGIRIPPGVEPYRGRYSRVRLLLRAYVDVAMGLDVSAEVPLDVS